MKTFISITLSIVAILLGGYAILHPQTITQFGATSNAGANALFEQSLAQPLGTTDANMYVTSGADVQGNLLPLNSYQCLSVDTGQPNFEAVCGTVTTSSSAGLTLAVTLRGLSTQTATTSNASFIFTHRRGADVRITDFPTLTVVNNQLNGVQAIPNPVFYSSNFTPAFWTGAASNTLATIGIVNSTASAGCGNASEIANGCSQLATVSQAAVGTSIGSTMARLVLGANLSTSTPGNSTVTGNIITTTGSKLSQLFLDLTQSFAFLSSITAPTSTLGTLNVGSIFATSSIKVGGLPVLTTAYSPAKYNIVSPNSFNCSTTTSCYATSTDSITIPANTLTASSTIHVAASIVAFSGSGGTPTETYYLRTAAGATLASCSFSTTATIQYSGYLTFDVYNQNSSSNQAGEVQCYMTNGTSNNLTVQGNVSSSINTAAATQLFMVVFSFMNGGNQNQANISNFSMLITP